MRHFLEHEFQDSTAIKSYRYFRPQQSLVVEFTSGKVYAYANVKEDLVIGWAAASSAGKYFHRWIKNHPVFKPDDPRDYEPTNPFVKAVAEHNGWLARVYFIKDYGHLPRRSAFDVFRERRQVHDKWDKNRRKHLNKSR